MENNQDFVIENGVLTRYKGPGGDVVIPEGVTEIGWCAFQNCTGLTSVTIPASVTKIRDSAFDGCTGLTEILTDTNNSVYRSVDGMLLEKDCLFLCPAGRTGNVTIPESVVKIGDWTFSGCTGLTSVTIPGSIREIGYVAFSRCTGLTSVTIPEGVTGIGVRAFDGCTGLTIHAPAGSYVEWYAKEYGIKFETL